MPDSSPHEYLTRLSRLLQAEDRAASAGLQPVQLHALHYLSRCNRYSDRPAAVAEYLGITKGTASQTLRVLEEAGLIAKQADAKDRRVVHLSLTRQGQRALAKAGSKRLLDQALEQFSKSERNSLEDSLQRLLQGMQRASGNRTFGICHTCRHFKKEAGGKYRCGLTLEPLKASETQLLCREHETTAA